MLKEINQQEKVLEFMKGVSAEEIPAEVCGDYAPFALNPLDGRYQKSGLTMSRFFSEYALVKYRVYVEVKWLEFFKKEMTDLDYFEEVTLSQWNSFVEKINNFSIIDFNEVKSIEKITNHDVKSVELYVANTLALCDMKQLIPLVHIGCTSEDITNTAYSLMISAALDEWILNAENLLNELDYMAEDFASVPMLAHTHGQPATPTTVGKELMVFSERLFNSLDFIKDISITAKWNGATGNYSAISTAFPEYYWKDLSQKFVEKYLGLIFNPITTQIESHDNITRLFDEMAHANNIIIDLNVDMWLYISKGYFKQIPKDGEVGSSVMPHKVNPINFENSEGNLTISNSLLRSFSDKLTKSRLQRDLSDSTVQRYIGIAFGASYLAFANTLKGLNKVEVDKLKISSDLNSKYEILAEPIQTVLRKNGIPDAYNQLKDLTRGKTITKQNIYDFVLSLNIPENDKVMLLNLTPESYIGYAELLATNLV